MTEREIIRVMIVDDHDIVRRGLSALLLVKPDLEYVGEARDGQQSLDVCECVQPDVILMDLVMPVLDGPSAIRAICERFPNVRIVALTSFQDRDLIHEALKAGATSYLLKNVSMDELGAAIRAAHAGRRTLAPEAAQVLLRAAQEGTAPGDDLSPREREVLALMAEGLSNPEIAFRLALSRYTARAHVSSVLAKLGAASRAEAVALAFRNHLVS